MDDVVKFPPSEDSGIIAAAIARGKFHHIVHGVLLLSVP